MKEQAKIGLTNAIYRSIDEGEYVEAFITSKDGRLTIHFGGRENIQAIKQWMLEYATSPEEELVTQTVRLDGKKQ